MRRGRLLRFLVPLALLGAAFGCRKPPAPALPAVAPAPPGAAPAVRFEDVTREAGLIFKQSHGGCGMRYFVEQVAAGAALFDADGDGDLDAYFPQPQPLSPCKFPEPLRQRLYLNDGKGRFTLKADAFGASKTDYGISAAVGDFDNDGRPDLYVACHGRNKLYRNLGGARFEDVTARSRTALGGMSTGAVWFDYDGDGFLDLYVCRYCEWSLATDIPCPGPGGKRDVCHPTTYPPSPHALFRNKGDGTFEDVTTRAGVGGERRRGLGAAAADLDGDGRLDLFVANDMQPNFLYHNRGDGTFEDVAMQRSVAFGLAGQSQANMGVAAGDADGDGDLDVLVTTFSNEPFTLYRNDGVFFTDVSAEAGISRPTLPYLGFGTGFLDVANRGVLDLFFANGHVSPFGDRASDTYEQANQLLVNDGRGRFTSVPEALPRDDVRVHRGAAFGDVDNDGRVDILVTSNDDRPTLLRNVTKAGNWLILRLIDRNGCATPIGTRCVATVGARTLSRVVLGGGSYGGDSDVRVHLGLGDRTAVDRLEIRWLSGSTQVLEHVAGNQVLTVRETVASSATPGRP